VWSYDSQKLAYIVEAKSSATCKCLATGKYEKNQDDPNKKDGDDSIDENNYADVKL
jgi:hypothetical protein